MQRTPDDIDYMNFLPTRIHKQRYANWKAFVLENIDAIIEDLKTLTVDEVLDKYSFTTRDLALLVRLHYLTDAEAEELNLRQIEQAVPL